MSSCPNSTAGESDSRPVRCDDPSDQGFERTIRERLRRVRGEGEETEDCQ